MILRNVVLLLISTFYLAGLFSCTNINNSQSHQSVAVDTLLKLGEKIRKTKSPADALVFLQTNFPSIKNKTTEDFNAYYNALYDIYSRELPNDNKRIELADKLIANMEGQPEGSYKQQALIQAYNAKANALLSKSYHNAAYEYFFKAKRLATDNADLCALSEFSYNMGMVTYRQHKYEKAKNHFLECLAERQHCPGGVLFFENQQNVLDNIGLSYEHMGLYDSAKYYYVRALTVVNEEIKPFKKNDTTGPLTSEAVILGNLADVYAQEKKYDTAFNLLNRSINFNIQKGHDNTDAAIDQIKLAKLFLSLNLGDSLKQTLYKIKGELDSIHSAFVEKEWYKLMWQNYAHHGDSLNAMRYAIAYQIKNDSFELSNRELMNTDVEGSIKSLEHENEIKLLEKDKEEQKLYLIISVIIIIATILLVLMMMRNSIRSSKDVQSLTELNNKISDQKVQLEQALKELEIRDKDKSRILRSVAHDVMSPISAIAALIDILISESEDASEDHKEILNLIREACNNSLNLSRDILDASVAIAPGQLHKEWIDIAKLIQSSVELLSVRAAEKHIQLNFTNQANGLQAFVNREKIWRVINNLIVNAIKFSFEKTHIQITLTKDDQNVVVSVQDFGMGIPEKNKAHIFDMFTESKMFGTNGEKPHGIGLSISLQVARTHGGNIWFESEEGKGTTFYLSFPINLEI